MADKKTRFVTPVILEIKDTPDQFDLRAITDRLVSGEHFDITMIKATEENNKPAKLTKKDGTEYKPGSMRLIPKSVAVTGPQAECIVVEAILADNSSRMPEGVIKAKAYNEDDELIKDENGRMITYDADIPLQRGVAIVSLAIIPGNRYAEILSIVAGSTTIEFAHSPFYKSIIEDLDYYIVDRVSSAISDDDLVVIEDEDDTSQE